ncbi:MAG: phosphoribosylglycinamide formyltransferase [Flavobacteriales bacterium]|nr:phosphoribosylglycinamide formyltransferase [Flavobacteriales bacterium]MCB9167049.1 phosphoribosylglycinamide formyltransferase [Flavobacteriales bacterium]
MVRIAILASGTGTNAEKLITRFRQDPKAEVVLVGCDRPGAGVLDRAWELGVPSFLFDGPMLRNGAVQAELQRLDCDLVVLAGFLRLIPPAMIKAFPRRIVNIHPALLPEHGGKGMYGERVHRAVLDAGAVKSGITIHFIDERYDEGEHLLQVACPVLPHDTPATLAARIHELEHTHYPSVVAQLVDQLGE